MNRDYWILIMGLFLSFAVANAGESKRSKSIHFEDELVEGINRKPLDSFNQISELNDSNQNHLYKKRKGFSDRNRILMKEWKRKTES
jgi:hypothetical protein